MSISTSSPNADPKILFLIPFLSTIPAHRSRLANNSSLYPRQCDVGNCELHKNAMEAMVEQCLHPVAEESCVR